MKYITGIYALNLPSPDGTPGDWHFSALDWNKVVPVESTTSIFGDWGLHDVDVPQLGRMPVATHIRACLDLIEQGKYGTAGGMRKNFIADERFTPIIFAKVSELKNSPSWKEIDAFMGKEYLCQWLNYKEERGANNGKYGEPS